MADHRPNRIPVLAFVDLDDTLFQTKDKCPPGEAAETAAIDRAGLPLSFMTEKQRGLLQWLLDTAFVVPTTGRNFAAYSRVSLKFANLAILNHGGTIVDEHGAPDHVWYETIRGCLMPEPLDQLRTAVEAYSLELDLRARAQLIGDHGYTLYLSVKQADANPKAIAALADFIRERLDPELRLISSAHNLAVLPRGISKGRAMREVIERRLKTHGRELIFGLADSPSDLGFLAASDFMILPIGSPLAQAVIDANRNNAGLGLHEELG